MLGQPATPLAPQAQARPPREDLDRVVAVVAGQAVTDSDVRKEWSIEQFVEGRPASDPPGAEELKDALERLIERKLILSELESDAPAAQDDAPDAAAALAEIRKKFPNQEAFRQALGSLGMPEKEITDRLIERQRMLAFIDSRLRPAASVDASEVEAYYRNTFLPELAKRGGQAPPLAEVEGRIREILTQQKINALLDDWLKELKQKAAVKWIAG